MKHPELNVLAIEEDGHRYVFIYTDDDSGVVLRELGRCAADPELTFTWRDAAVLSLKVRERARVT